MYTEEAHAAAQEHAHHVQRNIGQAELRASRLATLSKLSDARADAHGWGVRTVIDSSVADTILDTMSASGEPPAVLATGGVQADTMLDTMSASSEPPAVLVAGGVQADTIVDTMSASSAPPAVLATGDVHACERVSRRRC